jgi:hypothetical protein
MTVEDDEINKADELANQVIDYIDDILPDSDTAVAASTIFLLWIKLTRLLTEAGWSEKELVKDVRWHVKDAKANSGT